MRELVALVKGHLIEDPESLDSDSNKVEIRWIAWFKEESKLRRLAARLSEVRHSIAAALTALSAYDLHINESPCDVSRLTTQQMGDSSHSAQFTGCFSEQ